ncbi:MAG: TIGR04282 family arsenosugar biosynthesis glycosyltransferase [Cyanobacteria bacterium P01_G01_bin.54]
MPTTLIIFTRYPEPGKTKTRLIPALGAQGAAQLQRQMTEHTLRQAQMWQPARENRQVAVHFAGGNPELMRQWLGENWTYIPQAAGDLGDRLIAATAPLFQQTNSTHESSKVLVIGIDCPGIDVSILSQAEMELNNHDVVLGPTADGGYYLIGLRGWFPALFQEIAWSTEQVFAQTGDRARQLNLTIATLPPLRDVDYPEDLEVWGQVQAVTQAQSG